MIYRGFDIKAAPNAPTLLKVSVEGQGGRIPAILEGLHTSYGAVKSQIDHYLDNLKEATNGKTSAKSRD